MPTLWNDLRYALRQLRHSPGFALTVVLTLALDVGANAIVFSVLNALVLRPLPLPDAQQLVSLDRTGNTGQSPSSAAQSYLVMPATVYLSPGDPTGNSISSVSVEVGVRTRIGKYRLNIRGAIYANIGTYTPNLSNPRNCPD